MTLCTGFWQNSIPTPSQVFDWTHTPHFRFLTAHPLPSLPYFRILTSHPSPPHLRFLTEHTHTPLPPPHSHPSTITPQSLHLNSQVFWWNTPLQIGSGSWHPPPSPPHLKFCPPPLHPPFNFPGPHHPPHHLIKFCINVKISCYKTYIFPLLFLSNSHEFTSEDGVGWPVAVCGEDRDNDWRGWRPSILEDRISGARSVTDLPLSCSQLVRTLLILSLVWVVIYNICVCPRREARFFYVCSCLESQGCQFDPTFLLFLYLLSWSSA